MHRTLFTGFSPNTTHADVQIARSLLCNPLNWRYWRQGDKRERAEEMLTTYLGGGTVRVFDSGRSALLVALRALGMEEGDEVLVQAFTCVVVINAIKWAGGVPVYVDILPDTLNMDPDDAASKITPKTACMIIQHTFGLPADLSGLLAIAKQHGLTTIEDCAHSLGATYEGKYTGTFADIGMYSFGTEKIISCVRGGALVSSNPDIVERLTREQQALPEMSLRRIWQHLVHVVSFPFGKRYYHLMLGKLFLKFLKTTHLIPRLITNEEKQGRYQKKEMTKMPNALATLLVSQIPTIDEHNEHRKQIARIYTRALSSHTHQADSPEHVYLRYALFVNTASHLRAQAKQQGILLGDWYSTVVAPRDIDMRVLGYVPGSCPVAEEKVAQALNLPTGVSIDPSDAERILHFISE